MENHSKKKTIVSIIIVIIFIASIIALSGNKPPEKNIGISNKTIQKENTFTDSSLIQFSENEHILGNRNAEIIILEYSDTECPFCKIFHKTMQRVIQENNNKVAWIYRHYPIPQLHPKASGEAEATECAWKQGGNDAFWSYINRIFEITPSNNNLENSELVNIANYTNLDIPAFKKCITSGEFEKKVSSDVITGKQLGVKGTPISFIIKDGIIVDTIQGAQPYEMVLKKIEASLSN